MKYLLHVGDEGVNYDKLIKQFGSDPIDDKLLERIAKITSITLVVKKFTHTFRATTTSFS